MPRDRKKMAPLEDGAGGPGPVVEEGPQSFGDGEDELAHRDVGEDVVHQVGRGVGHALGVARGAGAPALQENATRKSYPQEAQRRPGSNSRFMRRDTAWKRGSSRRARFHRRDEEEQEELLQGASRWPRWPRHAIPGRLPFYREPDSPLVRPRRGPPQGLEFRCKPTHSLRRTNTNLGARSCGRG
jgi:hypothetical protein